MSVTVIFLVITKTKCETCIKKHEQHCLLQDKRQQQVREAGEAQRSLESANPVKRAGRSRLFNWKLIATRDQVVYLFMIVFAYASTSAGLLTWLKPCSLPTHSHHFQLSIALSLTRV